MAVSVEISYVDVFGKVKRGRATVADAAGATALMPLLKALTNCQIASANLLTPVDLTGVSGNTAANADMSSAEAQARINLTGAIPTGGTRKARTSVTIPAFKGSLVTGGDKVNITDINILNLRPYLKDKDGNDMDTVSSGRVL